MDYHQIMHLCKQSNVGCNLYEDKLPLDPQLINVCEEFDIDSDGSDKRR
jgi:thiamine-monophosphate kinase